MPLSTRTRWIDQDVLELNSSAYLHPKVDEKAAERQQSGEARRRPEGGSRKLWTPPRRELAATTLQMHSPVDSNSIRLPVFSPLLSPVAQ